MPLDPLAQLVDSVVDKALAEDEVWRDVTTQALIADTLEGRAAIVAKEEGVLAGMGIASRVFAKVDPDLKIAEVVPDATRLAPQQKVAVIEGRVASILKGERVALNFLQHLSGIATLTARYVAAVSGTAAQILDTRKTTPGLRGVEKYAVRVGGGHNHRMSLGEAILIKDNHLAALAEEGVGLGEAIRRCRHNTPRSLKIEVEVETVEQAEEAVEAGADILLLDNMSIREMRRAVEIARGRALTEASGGITLRRAPTVARTGVDFISVGALTHSARALDLSLELDLAPGRAPSTAPHSRAGARLGHRPLSVPRRG